jgi:hypothetical protein
VQDSSMADAALSQGDRAFVDEEFDEATIAYTQVLNLADWVSYFFSCFLNS